ncbi:hypothetical protein BLA29_014885 [Euroglyphus maynei]|uniref:Uncharacterized protein n=1 Tax=Euroglyphus maynei TaxID=6958 RepID=A0A1Y3BNA1_EURMA|nr:hypothetical protein BLA29_014885 [Euroglyphus maynei]
MNRMNLVDD